MLDDKIKMVIGDLVVQVAIAQQKIEDLEKQLNDQKESGTGVTEGGAQGSS